MTTSVREHYEYIRDKNQRLLRKREMEVMEKSPELKDIDLQLREISLSLAACFLNSGIDIDDLIDHAKARTAELHKQKRDILISMGYPEDYLDEIYDCKICKDRGVVNDRPCSCYNAYRTKLSYNESNLSMAMEKQNFDNFDYSLYSLEPLDEDHPLYSPDSKSLRDYMRLVVRELKLFVEKDRESGVYLYGSTGVGKTFLCSSIAKYAIDKFKSVRYYSMNQFMDICESYKFDKNEDRMEAAKAYRELYDVDILILDDLGADIGGRLVISELFSVINERLAKGMKTVISSNISPHEISASFDERIASRILGEYGWYYIDGYDLRSVKNY